MKKLQINKEHRILIESVIRQNEKFRGNEELIDIFCEAIYKKSYLLIDAIRDMTRLKRHLGMITDTCMEQIIKEKRKFDSSKRKYAKPTLRTAAREKIISLKKPTVLHEKSTQPKYQSKKEIVNLKEEIQRSEKYSASNTLIDPLEFCPKKRVSEHTVDKLVSIIKTINDKYPRKHYYDIFALRYIKRKNQMEIAHELRISQAELSKRFVEMIKLAHESV